MFRINKSRQLDRRPLIPSKGHFYVTGYLSSPVSKGQPAEYIYNGNRIRTSFETLNSIYTISYLKVSAENRVLCA